MNTNNVPNFQPTINTTPGLGQYYDDGRVFGDIEWFADRKSFTIFTWSSRYAGNGYTKDALEWIRSQLGATHIHVEGAGQLLDGKPDNTVAYWLYLASQGLVDTVNDDMGDPLFPDPLQASPSP